MWPSKARTRKTAFNPDGESDVKSDNAEGATTEPDGFGNHDQVVAHESDIGRLNRCVGACRAHRNADIGGGKSGCVIYTIADHADTAEIVSEFPDLFDLLLGQKVTLGFVDASLSCDCLCGAGVVAAQHDHLANAGIVKKPNSLGRIRANSITDRENAENFSFAISMWPMAYDDDGFRIGLDLGQHGFEFFGADAEFVR